MWMVSVRRLSQRAELTEEELAGVRPVRRRSRRAARRLARTVLNGRSPGRHDGDVARVLAQHLALQPLGGSTARKRGAAGSAGGAAGDAEPLAAALRALAGEDAQQGARPELVRVALGCWRRSRFPDPAAVMAAIAVPEQRARAGQALVDLLADCWRQARDPALLAVLRRAAAPPATAGDGRPQLTPDREAAANVPLLLLLGGSGQDADALAARHPDALAAALGDPDGEVRAAAADVLRACTAPAVHERLVQAWLAGGAGTAALTAVLAENPRLPDEPRARLLVAALKQRDDVIAEHGADAAETLLAYLDDPRPPELAQAVHRALRSLADPAAREQVCAAAVRGRPHAAAVVLDAGYLPAAEPDRAALLILTGQWERYESLDFDGRLTAAAYAAADEAVRARLREAARASGRADVLRMMLGGDRRARARALGETEADYLVTALMETGRHDEVWRMLPTLRFGQVLAAVARLRRAGFEPRQPPEAALFQTLAETGRHHDPARTEQQVAALPWAAQVAMTGLGGEVRGLSFAPDGPHLAVIVNTSQVGLWDLAADELLWQRELPRPLDLILHSGQDRIWVAERFRNPGQPCGVYLVDAAGHHRLGQHGDQVSALLPTPDGGMLSASRDGTLAVWDATGERRRRLPLGSNHRPAVALSPDGSRLAVAQRDIVLYDWPVQERLMTLTLPTGWTAPVSLAFAPEGAQLLLCWQDGQVSTAPASPHPSADGPLRHTPEPVIQVWPPARSRMADLLVFPDPPEVLAVSSEGKLTGLGWPELKPTWRGRTSRRPDGQPRRILSAAKSPDHALLALGHHDGTASLWIPQLGHQVRKLLRQPVEDIAPGGLRMLDAAAETVPAAGALAAMLRHRFRHDIHLGALGPTTRHAGRHDIELA